MGDRTTVGGLTVITASGELGPPAVGFVANRSVGSAVVRNRARRRLRAAMAQATPPHSTDIIVVATTEVNNAPFDDLVGWLRQAMEEIR